MTTKKETVKPGEIKLRSRLKEIFPIECLLELDELTMNHTADTNTKSKVCDAILQKYGVKFKPLGCGTNRYGIMIDGYCYKIAMDIDGKTDNKREFIYSRPLQPYVIKCYETFPNGLIASFEYVQSFTANDHMVTKTERRRILSEIARLFLIGDMGISDKNYANWGYRITGDKEVVILDYAYIYSLSYSVFRCPCGGILNYDDEDYNYLRCPNCKKLYSFWDVRKRIPRVMETNEIGDMLKRGYILKDSEEIVQIDPNFSEGRVKKKERHVNPEFDALKKKERDAMRDIGVSKTPTEMLQELDAYYKREMEEQKNGKAQQEIILGGDDDRGVPDGCHE